MVCRKQTCLKNCVLSTQRFHAEYSHSLNFVKYVAFAGMRAKVRATNTIGILVASSSIAAIIDRCDSYAGSASKWRAHHVRMDIQCLFAQPLAQPILDRAWGNGATTLPIFSPVPRPPADISTLRGTLLDAALP